MTTLEILNILQHDIHSTVFATVDEQGLPGGLHQPGGAPQDRCGPLPALRQLPAHLPGESGGETGRMKRRSFLIGCAGCAAAGVLGVSVFRKHTDETSYLPLEQPLKRDVMADIHCFEQDDPAGDSTVYMFDR